ncbi:MAG: DUF512 domain-containing protein [Lachnospiraceae bacterium]|nr:DUF512 domain-containing protein [Lachnospiraceae bacterium]
MENTGHRISGVEPDSISEELGIMPGDELLAINGNVIEDILDYQFLCEDDYVELTIRRQDGEEWIFEVDKDEDEDLGLSFENGLMDGYRSCRNHCIFCFIDQMPKGMRPTLYFKDDDSRLSFLQGNYVTLTNMSEKDIDRIIRYRLEPINISVHCTDPDLREKMLKNPRSRELKAAMDKLFEAGIRMNGQIVLCKGINDGKVLSRSIEELSRYIPCLESVSVVPVGLTRFRDGLFPLDAFTSEDSAKVLEEVHAWQEKLFEAYGTHFIHAGDEFYLSAGWELPDAASYDGYLQYENGVGMLRSFIDEFDEALKQLGGARLPEREVSIAGGMLMQKPVENMLERLRGSCPALTVRHYAIKNDFFGERVTVNGLLTGGDIINSLKGRPLGDCLYLPENLLRSGTETLLDDVTVSQISSTLQVKVDIVKSDGWDFVEKLTGIKGREE